MVAIWSVAACAARFARPRGVLSPLPARCLVTMSAAKRRVVFLGTPAVAARSLELLLDASAQGGGGGFEVAAVVSQPPARSGRKMKLTASPVQTLAEARGIELLTPASAKEEAFLARLDELQPDLCITAAYGCFLPQRFLDIPRFGTLNVHPSLLPLYRGAAPLQRCLEAGDAVAGVSVAFTVLKMDAGPLLRQEERPLVGDEQEPPLLLELFERGTELLLDALPSVWDGSCAGQLAPQEDARATKAAKLSTADAELRLEQLSASEAHNKVRAFAGWPGTWTRLSICGAEPIRVKLLQTRLGLPEAAGDPPPAGRQVALAAGGGALRLVCGDGSLLEVLRLTLPGKKPVDARAFWNGLNGRRAEWASAPPDAAAAPEHAAASAPPEPLATAVGAKRQRVEVTEPPPPGFTWGGKY